MSSNAAEKSMECMTIIDHLQELRKRLIFIIVAVIITSSVCYYFADKIVNLLTMPVGKLYYLSPAEAFFAYVKVSVFAGFLVAMPIICYEIWAFISPALTRKESAAIKYTVPASILLFAVGLAFCHYFIIPAAIKFFMSYANDGLQPMFSLGQYLQLVLSCFIIFGFIFEMPLVIIILAQLGILNSKQMSHKRKVMFVMAFVIGIFIAPTPDVVSQCMVAVPLIFLYEISLLVVKHILRK